LRNRKRKKRKARGIIKAALLIEYGIMSLFAEIYLPIAVLLFKFVSKLWTEFNV